MSEKTINTQEYQGCSKDLVNAGHESKFPQHLPSALEKSDLSQTKSLIT